MKKYTITYKTSTGTKFDDTVECTDKFDAIQLAKAKAMLYGLILLEIKESYTPINTLPI